MKIENEPLVAIGSTTLQYVDAAEVEQRETHDDEEE